MRPLPELPGVRHAHHDLPTGVRTHVAEAGDPGAPPILAVHGWPQHWWAWRGVIPALAETHRVICPDLRASAGAGSRTTATSRRSGSRTTCSRCSTSWGSSAPATSGTTGAAGPAGWSRSARPSVSRA